MKTKWIVMSLTVGALAVSPLWAAPSLNSGSYQAQINPAVDSQTATNLGKALDGIQEIDHIAVDPSGGAVRFHVKDNQSVDYARIQNAVQAAAPNNQLQQVVLLNGVNGALGTSGASGTTSSNASTNASFTLQQNGVSYVCSPQH